MIRLVKKIRQEYQLRGYFSYLLEAVIEIIWAHQKFDGQEIKVYFDLVNVHHYKQPNLFDVCFIQDHEDYLQNKSEYVNIESLNSEINFNHYDLKTFPNELRYQAKKIIQKYFILKEEYEIELSNRLKKLNLSNTVSVHRRDTDMRVSHHIAAPVLEQYYSIIDSSNYDNIFVMSDNAKDLKMFQEKYGNKFVSFEEDTTSNNPDAPFFLSEDSNPESMKRHIINLTLNTFILSKTKKLICSKSNLSAFAIMFNPELDYIKLN